MIVINTKIALSALSIVAALSLMGGAAFAFFSNTGTSNSNVFSSGTLDLVLSDASETDLDNVTASFGGTNLAPNQCLAPATLNIKNLGTVAGNHIDVSATNTNSAFAAFLKISSITFDGSPVAITDSNLNTFVDLQDLATNGIVNKPVTDFVNHPLVMTVCLDQSAGNPQQGQTDTLDLSVLLDQGPH